MARIKLSDGYTMIPEGSHVFYINDVEYDETFGKVSIHMQTATGRKHTERYNLIDNNGNENPKAMNAFSYFAKNALNRFDALEIDHADLIGHYIRAEVLHTEVPSTKEEGKMKTFVNLGEKSPATGFEEPASKASGDLLSVLG